MTKKQFKTWRQKRSLTQVQAAKLIGVSLDTVKSWEIGRRKIPKTIEKLLNLINY